MRRSIEEGKIWVLLNREGGLIEDIDTDQIYHNAHLHITELSKMGQYALGNLEGWKDFPKKAAPGDLLVAGRNFGAGSSRQQAVACFIYLKISLILAPSFGAIYFRNAVNSGLPVMRCPGLEELIHAKSLETGDRIRVDMESGESQNLNKNILFACEPMSLVQYALFQEEGLFNYGRKLSQEQT